MNENEKLVEQHKEICNHLNEIYEIKNHDYGNSFGETFDKLGIISAITRIADKYNRLVNLTTNGNTKVNDESIEDTLLDMANYCIMTVMELNKGKAALQSCFSAGFDSEIIRGEIERINKEKEISGKK